MLETETKKNPSYARLVLEGIEVSQARTGTLGLC